jgi:hypothetical protein
MTGKSYKLGMGRMYFDADALPKRPPGEMRTMSGTFSVEIDMPPFRHARIAQDWFGLNPIPHLVGYNPQKLLPAPGSNPDWFRRDMLAFIASQLGTPYMTENVFKPSDFKPSEISPTGRRIGMVPELAAPYGGWRHKRAVLTVGSDFGPLEQRILAVMSMESVVAVHIDFNCGDIYHYDPVFRDMVPMSVPDKPLKQNGRSAAYLDRDPTKNHRRKRR